MCTLIIFWRAHSSAPLILAANRDEFLERPTAPMAAWPPSIPGGPVEIVAGRDLTAGGTWLGVGRGVVAALTNHRAGARSKPGSRSRGELVERALRQPSVAHVRDELLALPAPEYGLFHLVAADRNEMIWATNRAGEMEISSVAPGAHILGNYGLNNPDDPVVVNLRGALEGAMDLSEGELEIRLRESLARGGPGWPLVRLGPYGTRSSAMLWWGNGRPRLLSAEGPPDTMPFADLSRLLDDPAPHSDREDSISFEVAAVPAARATS